MSIKQAGLRFRTISLLTVVFLSIELCRAQVSLPQLGIKIDTDGVHTIMGIPGSARIGKRLDLNLPLRPEIALDQQFMMGVRESDRHVVLIELQNTSMTVSAIEGTFIDPDRLAISPSGSSAAIYDSHSGAIQIIAGLPKQTRVQAVFPMSISGSPSALAVSDDGAAVLFAADGFLWSVSDGAPLRVGPARGNISAIQFLRNSQDAVVADQVFNEVRLIKGDRGNPESVLYSSRDGISQPVGIGISRDNKRLIVANGNTGTVGIASINDGHLVLIACGFEIVCWYPLSLDSAFLLTDTRGASFILDARTNEPRLSFVLPQLVAP